MEHDLKELVAEIVEDLDAAQADHDDDVAAAWEAEERPDLWEAPEVSLAIPRVRAILSELSRLQEENERLRLAMLGGEDAPGFAASLTIEEVLEAFHTHAAGQRDRAEQAEYALEAALALSRPMPSREEVIRLLRENLDLTCGRNCEREMGQADEEAVYAETANELLSLFSSSLGGGEEEGSARADLSPASRSQDQHSDGVRG